MAPIPDSLGLKWFGRWSALLVGLCLQVGCLEKDSQTQKVQAVIHELIEADNNSDIETVLGAYTDSVEFYPTGGRFTKGIQNVRANYNDLFLNYDLSLETEILEARIMGDNAMVTGINTGTKRSIADSSTTKIHDKYIAILILGPKGNWRIDKLIWGPAH